MSVVCGFDLFCERVTDTGSLPAIFVLKTDLANDIN